MSSFISWLCAMPRCCNENKAVSSVSTSRKHNTEDILLTQTRAFAIGDQLELDEDPPIVEKSHRRVRCDLSPVPTNTSTNLSIKLLSIKVNFWQTGFCFPFLVADLVIRR